MVGEEGGEVGGTAEEGEIVEAGEDSGGEVIAEAGEASHPGKIGFVICNLVEIRRSLSQAQSCLVVNVYVSSFLLFSFAYSSIFQGRGRQ